MVASGFGFRFEGTVVTNEKTGDSVQVGRTFSRSNHKQKELAIKILRARQWAREDGYGPSEEIVANYENPDDEPFPHHQPDYRDRPLP
jgi:hypothetical protein